MRSFIRFHTSPGFELTYRDSGSTMHFSFFTIVSPTYQKFTTPKQVCFLNHETKANLSCFKVKNYHNVVHILFFIKTVTLLPSWYKIIFSNINCSQFLLQFISVIFFSFPCIDITLRIVLQLLNVVLSPCVIKNYIVASHVLYKTQI